MDKSRIEEAAKALRPKQEAKVPIPKTSFTPEHLDAMAKRLGLDPVRDRKKLTQLFQTSGVTRKQASAYWDYISKRT